MNLNVGEGDQRRELLHQVGVNLPELTSTSDWITRGTVARWSFA